MSEMHSMVEKRNRPCVESMVDKETLINVQVIEVLEDFIENFW
jgi:hypothetical protein